MVCRLSFVFLLVYARVGEKETIKMKNGGRSEAGGIQKN
jgi:hypothetical protein